MLVAFMLVPGIWETLFGPTGAPVAALVALGGVVWSSSRLMRVADRLMNDPEHRQETRRLAPAQEEAGTPSDWYEYNAAIMRNKRWAFYRRTRQFDRLAEMGAEDRRNAGASQNARNAANPAVSPAQDATEQNRRGNR